MTFTSPCRVANHICLSSTKLCIHEKMRCQALPCLTKRKTRKNKQIDHLKLSSGNYFSGHTWSYPSLLVHVLFSTTGNLWQAWARSWLNYSCFHVLLHKMDGLLAFLFHCIQSNFPSRLLQWEKMQLSLGPQTDLAFQGKGNQVLITLHK